MANSIHKNHLDKRINDRLQRIANVLLLNASFIDNIGLVNGKMGIAIFFYHYSRYTKSKLYEDFAGELIDEIYEEINVNTPVNFSDGLTGIGWGIEYLVKNKFIEGVTDEVLAEIDSTIYKHRLSSPILINSGDDLFGYGFYHIARLKGHTIDDEDLKTLIKKQHLIFLTDECERLLIHKRYLDFNILALSPGTINSLIWFLLEMEKLGLSPAKVRNVLTFLPNLIKVKRETITNRNEWYLLQNLAKEIVSHLADDPLKKEYQLLIKRIENELNQIRNCNKSVVEIFQSFALLKLIYRPYLDTVVFDWLSFEKAFWVIETDWEHRLNRINKSNLGLSGFAGCGLMLLNAVEYLPERILNLSPSKPENEILLGQKPVGNSERDVKEININ